MLGLRNLVSASLRVRQRAVKEVVCIRQEGCFITKEKMIIKER